MKSEDFTKVNHDTSGNPRYVCHFLQLINEGDKIKADTKGIGFVSEEYAIALTKAKAIGGRKYHTKGYGGGIIFQSYNIHETAEEINQIKEVNTNFLTEWTPKQFKQVEKAIYRHMVNYTYKRLDNHDQPLKDFRPLTYEQISNTLGLAYTSTGLYAGLWVCNSGYLMANKTHHFTGFALNTDGKAIGIVEDENENEIFIEL